jgi:hypothetical protein
MYLLRQLVEGIKAAVMFYKALKDTVPETSGL